MSPVSRRRRSRTRMLRRIGVLFLLMTMFLCRRDFSLGAIRSGIASRQVLGRMTRPKRIRPDDASPIRRDYEKIWRDAVSS